MNKLFQLIRPNKRVFSYTILAYNICICEVERNSFKVAGRVSGFDIVYQVWLIIDRRELSTFKIFPKKLAHCFASFGSTLNCFFCFHNALHFVDSARTCIEFDFFLFINQHKRVIFIFDYSKKRCSSTPKIDGFTFSCDVFKKNFKSRVPPFFIKFFEIAKKISFEG